MENPFNGLDFTYEDAQNTNQQLDSKRLDRDNRICICGHSIKRHGTDLRGNIHCKPSALYCPCRTPRAVLETQDVRDFQRKTLGAGKLHALGRGLATAVEKQHQVTWLIEIKCDKCGEQGNIAPTPVKENGDIAHEATAWNALLCRTCRTGN